MAVDSRDGELAAWLAENREPLLRRWLGLVVERSSLSELAGRPFGERMQELDLLLEAARSHAGDEPDAAPGARPPATPEPLLAALETRRGAGAPFSIAIFDAPSGDGPPARAWAQAIAFVTRPGEPAFPAGGGATAVLLDAASARDARVAAHGIRAGAWELLGGRCALPEVGVAVHPDDPDLLAAARRRAATPEPHGPRAGDLWQALAEERDRAADDEVRPPAPVTPLRPL